MSDEAKALAARILAEYGGLQFGICKFYGLGQMAANDQTYAMVSVEADGDALSIGFRHASGSGNVGFIRVKKPRVLRAASLGKGFEIESADSLELDDSRVERQGKADLVQTVGTRINKWSIRPGDAALLLTA